MTALAARPWSALAGRRSTVHCQLLTVQSVLRARRRLYGFFYSTLHFLLFTRILDAAVDPWVLGYVHPIQWPSRSRSHSLFIRFLVRSTWSGLDKDLAFMEDWVPMPCRSWFLQAQVFVTVRRSCNGFLVYWSSILFYTTLLLNDPTLLTVSSFYSTS